MRFLDYVIHPFGRLLILFRKNNLQIDAFANLTIKRVIE